MSLTFPLCSIWCYWVMVVVLQAPEGYKEFSLGLTSAADTSGITLAGVSAIFVHNYICDHAVDIPSSCPSWSSFSEHYLHIYYSLCLYNLFYTLAWYLYVLFCVWKCLWCVSSYVHSLQLRVVPLNCCIHIFLYKKHSQNGNIRKTLNVDCMQK